MEAVAETVTVAREHQNIGLADASLIALAAQLETIRVVTLDESHFRIVRPLTGKATSSLTSKR